MRTGKKPHSEFNWEGVNYRPGQTTKDIGKILRGQLKKDFPNAKWSITTDYSEINIALMSYDKSISTEGYIDLGNGSYIDRKPITDEGKLLLKRATELAQSFNYNDSNAYIDYFDVGFYLRISIGKYNRPFTINNK